MPEAQAKAIAEAHAEALSESVSSILAIKTDLAELKVDLIKWMVGIALAQLRLKALLTTKTIQLATPRAEKIKLYGDGERTTINLALERGLLLLIDDWRPLAGVKVANTPAYLLQLYAKAGFQ
jgi:hypothetical protein